MVGQLIESDFEENTMTLKIEDKMTVRAGKYLVIWQRIEPPKED